MRLVPRPPWVAGTAVAVLSVQWEGRFAAAVVFLSRDYRQMMEVHTFLLPPPVLALAAHPLLAWPTENPASIFKKG